ncbi:recombinase family protein [Methylorubrum thiocyanatum]
MIYGYARVSTEAQDLANQRAQLTAAGCEKIFADKFTGTSAERPQLKKLLAALAPGDLLVIAREMYLAGTGLRSIAEPVVDTSGDFAEVVLAVLGVTAKLERRRIIDRTTRGRADAKAAGVKFGRKPKLTHYQQQEARKRLEACGTQRSVAGSFNVSQSTIARLPAL